MKKLSSFKYKGMIFHNTKDNLFQTDRFGSKLIYEKIGEEYRLGKDERLSPIGSGMVSSPAHKLKY